MKKRILLASIVASLIIPAAHAGGASPAVQANTEKAARALLQAQQKLDFDRGRGADKGTIAADTQDREEAIKQIEGLTGKTIDTPPSGDKKPSGDAF